jgi:transposase
VTRSRTRRYGRAPKGERVPGAVPLGHGEVTTLIGALSLDGLRARFSVDAATDADLFQVFVEQILQPALRPGDVVVWDNLPAHKAPKLRPRIEAAQATLLPLPPYSPDFNPIEQGWSKVKQFLRAAEARTKETLEQAIANAFAGVTASDARGWFHHCGYGSTSNANRFSSPSFRVASIERELTYLFSGHCGWHGQSHADRSQCAIAQVCR